MRRRSGPILAALVVALAVVGVYALAMTGSSYDLKLVMRSVSQVVPGSPIWIDGVKAGEVDTLETRNGKAVVTATVYNEYSPLHDGTTARVEWKSVLGERVITLYPGPKTNPEIPDGAMYEVKTSQVELENVLSALDKPTRKDLSSLFRQLNQTLNGREKDLRATLRSAGPTVRALGDVLEGIGQDGAAIGKLVSQLRQMTATIAERQASMREVVSNTADLTDTVAKEQAALREGLSELPSTLKETDVALDRIPTASEETIGLLQDLEPATRRLPSVARDLSPVLSDLRAVVGDLRPTLVAAERLLQDSPTLIDTAHGVLPPLEHAMDTLSPAVAFLRPYTPELAGWLTNWNAQYATYDSQGHMWSGLLAFGPSEVNEAPVVIPPLSKPDELAPGAAVGQPWKDANGSTMQ